MEAKAGHSARPFSLPPRRCYHRGVSSDRLLPGEWQRGPRYGGAYTFASCPASRDLSRADVAVVGVPMDMAVLYRAGARFGPRGIRDASGQLRPHGWEPDEIEALPVEYSTPAFVPIDR